MAVRSSSVGDKVGICRTALKECTLNSFVLQSVIDHSTVSRRVVVETQSIVSLHRLGKEAPKTGIFCDLIERTCIRI
jgi:hypothetical protein